MHNSQRVLESGMHCTRVDVVGPGKLAYSAQALERRLVDDGSLPVVDFDEAVDRTSDLVFSVRRLHSIHNIRFACQAV